MQIGWKLENCYKPITSQLTQPATGGKDENQSKDDDTDTVVAPALESESPRRLSPAKKTLQTSEADVSSELPDGAGEPGSPTTQFMNSQD